LITRQVDREVRLSRMRIVLADDNSAILEHATRLLAAEFDVVGTFSDGEAILAAVEQIRPDVVVLDISMPKMNGIEVARCLFERGHQMKVVFLTVHEEKEFVCAAFGAGGAGYVIKSRLDPDLTNALSAVLAGRVFVSPSMLHA
jgi:DNA-binding NarL/FixJ family response regulator